MIHRTSLVLCFFLLATHLACTGWFFGRKPTVLLGETYITGNEPFTRLAFRCTTGKTYLLEGPDDVMETLWKMQGIPVTLYCSKILVTNHTPIARIVRSEPSKTTSNDRNRK